MGRTRKNKNFVKTYIEKITGVILSDQIKIFDWSKRNATFIIKAPKEKVKEVAEKAIALINGV
jgi:mRNA-degrading endonuclease toxin of MazEF toxin-antitoxin module